MKKILLCVFILLVSVNVFANDFDIDQLTKQAENGDAEAQYQLGECYFYGNGVTEDDNQAADWYTKAAEQGHAEAQHALGVCYAEGYGATQNYKEAVKWFALSANQNNAYGQGSLGYCYANGYGVSRNNELAYMWYYLSLPNMLDIEDKGFLEEIMKELEIKMTPAEIAEAQQMAVEWVERHR